MDWTNKNIHPSKIVQLGDEVEVMILDIDQERRRISLGIKQCKQNPWDAFATKYQKGDPISGNIKSITDFGIFIGLEGDIDGLVHLSDISWDEPGEQAVRQFTKGDKLETVILSVDPERERISLGVKQMSGDPFVNFLSSNEKGAVVKGTIKSVDAKEAIVTLTEGVEGILKSSEISRERVEDARTVLNVGDQIDLMITNVDRKNRILNLSIKAKDMEEEKDSVKEHNSKMSTANAAPATVGDLIKAKMNKE
jgi:small subunit ribosomal protein S1